MQSYGQWECSVLQLSSDECYALYCEQRTRLRGFATNGKTDGKLSCKRPMRLLYFAFWCDVTVLCFADVMQSLLVVCSVWTPSTTLGICLTMLYYYFTLVLSVHSILSDNSRYPTRFSQPLQVFFFCIYNVFFPDIFSWPWKDVKYLGSFG